MKKLRAFSMVLSRGVVIISEDVSVANIARIMASNNVGAVPVMKGEKLIGIVSERDIVRRVISRNLSPAKVKAKDCMTKKVITVNFKSGLNNIYKTLAKIEFRHLPIMEKGKLVGMASQRDILFSLLPKK